VRVFDWDDTIMYMPTKIRLFKKGSNESILVTTGEFAAFRLGHLGKAYADYETREFPGRPEDGSFQYFRQAGSVNDDLNHFRDHIDFALQTKTEAEWQGPAFQEFTKDLATPESAAQTYIVTARGHAPEEMMEGLKVLQRWLAEVHQVKIFLPPIENLVAVGTSANPSARKAEVLVELARKWKAAGKRSLEFIDDDLINVKSAEETFEKHRFELAGLETIVTHVSREKGYEAANEKTFGSGRDRSGGSQRSCQSGLGGSPGNGLKTGT
jgi:hypothetical protein